MDNIISERTYRGLVLTLDPMSSDKIKLSKSLDISRWFYNQLVEEYLNCIKENRLPKYPSFPELRENHKFLEDMESWACSTIRMNFIQTNKINRKKRSKGQSVGLRRFKCKKDHNDSYPSLITGISYDPDDASKSYVKIPKIGKVRFKNKNIDPIFLKDSSKVKYGIIRRTKTGVYTVSLLVEANKVYEDRVDNGHIGLDFSLRDLFVDSFGAKAPEFSTKRSKMESLRKKIDSLNTAISKMRNKSKKKRKVSVKVHRITMKRNKLYERVHNVQKDYLNKLSRSLCQHNELIVLEDLNLHEMSEHTSYKDSKTPTKGGNHGKSIGLLQWSYFLKKLEENSEKFRCHLVLADKFYPSSQICSSCGKIHSEMKDVTRRTLECECGNIIDRDYNSAINLLKFGETVVYNKSYQTLGKGLSEYKTFKHLDFCATHKPQMSELELQLL